MIAAALGKKLAKYLRTIYIPYGYTCSIKFRCDTGKQARLSSGRRRFDQLLQAVWQNKLHAHPPHL